MNSHAEAIRLLASADARERRNAALELYSAGRSAADSVVSTWLSANAELSELFTEQVLDIAALSLKPRSQKVVVGVAVRHDTFQKIHEANGSPPFADVPPDQDAMEFELHFTGADLDILTSRYPAGDGAIAKFLEKFGEGIQQVEYFVADVDRATEILRSRFGVKFIYPHTRAGADGTRVNFFLTATPEGHKVLIELVQS